LSTSPLADIETELAKLPPAVLEAYREAAEPIRSAFGEEELILWAKEGLAVGTQTVRSWESAVEYYRVGSQRVNKNGGVFSGFHNLVQV